jgi:hypothetical protein
VVNVDRLETREEISYAGLIGKWRMRIWRSLTLAIAHDSRDTAYREMTVSG